MSDPQEPPRPDGSGDAPAPPPPPASNPYGAPQGGGGGYGQADYGQYGQQPGPPPPGQPAYDPTAPRPGGLGERFVARFIDGVIVAIVAGIIDALLLVGAFGFSGGSGLGVGGSYAYALVAAVIGAALNFAYFGFLDSTRGQTVGKMALRLHVEQVSGGLPTFEQSVRRNIWLALPLLAVVPLVGGLIGSLGELLAVIMIAVGISSDRVARRPWTDKLGGTRIVKRP